MNAITSSGRKVETMFSYTVPPFVKYSQIPAMDKCRSAQELAAMIHWQWAQAGHEVQVWVEADGSIHSDTINGLPIARVQPSQRGA